MVLGLTYLLTPLFVIAQNIDSIERAFERKYDLRQVVITATRKPKTLLDVPVPTRLIGMSEIERADATNIQDMLQQAMPGLEFTFSFSQQPLIDIQGLGGNNVLFLLDGERQAGETFDNVDFYRLTMIDVERIEVVKGAASCLYGSNAMGGVINIISREPVKPWALRLNGKVGAHGEQRYGGVFSISNERWRSSTTMQYSTINDIDLRRDGQVVGQLSDIYGNSALIVKERLIFNASKRLRLTARGSLYGRERNSSLVIKDRYYDAAFGLRGDYIFDNGNSAEVSYSFDQYDKGPYSTLSEAYSRTYRNRQHVVHAMYNHSFHDDMQAIIGCDILGDYLQSYEFTDSGSHAQQSYSAFLQMDWSITKRFSLLAGARYDFFSAASLHHLSPRISLMYRLNHVNLRAGYADGFRAPSLKEMYMDFDMPAFWIYGNPDLLPEKNHNFQLSAEYYNDRLTLMLLGYHNIVSNRISTAWYSALGGHRYLNMESMTISGVECSGTLHTDIGISATAAYAYTHESVRKGLPINVSCRPHSATLHIDYVKTLRSWKIVVGFGGRLFSSMDSEEYVAIGELENTTLNHYPGYALFKANMMISHERGVTLNLTVDNLFNYIPDYYYIKSPITTGRTFSVSLTVDVEKIF